ncbi:MAG TPA: YqgE/AlgH family protein, partial [Gammaproteobacteria bacterium]|nr:YqgE/AlgH family protein [Gammaproteobacteria bacterium]
MTSMPALISLCSWRLLFPCCLLTVAALWLPPVSATNTAPGVQAPLQRGVVLLARARLPDPRFRDTVILLTHYDQHGAMGFIVNRPTPMRLSHVVPGLAKQSLRRQVLHFGGPVGMDHVFVLVQSRRSHGMAHVSGEVYVGQGMQALRHIAASLEEDEQVRAYAGYAGWGAGQLEAEVARGDWLALPAGSADVFTREPGQLWRR